MLRFVLVFCLYWFLGVFEVLGFEVLLGCT